MWSIYIANVMIECIIKLHHEGVKTNKQKTNKMWKHMNIEMLVSHTVVFSVSFVCIVSFKAFGVVF